MITRHFPNYGWLVALLCLSATVATAEPSLSYTDDLVLWLKANAGVYLDGPGVTTWADQANSDGAQNASQFTSDRRPMLMADAIEGYPAVAFNHDGATNDRLNGASVLSGTVGRTVFVVFNKSSGSAGDENVMFDLAGQNSSPGNGGGYRLTTEMALRVNSGYRTFSESSGTTDFRLFTVQTPPGGNTNTSDAWLDGVKLSQASVNPRDIDTASSGYRIGHSAWAGVPFSGLIAEILVYKAALNDTQRQAVESYLSEKYFPPLPGVWAMAVVPNATEAGPAAGSFTISRTPPLNNPMFVNFSLGGRASNGFDYELLPESVIIQPGQASVSVEVMPIDDTNPDADETVVLTLEPKAGVYEVGTPPHATVTITDDDTWDDWQNQTKLSFNNAGQDETLIDFPVLVVLTPSRVDYSTFGSPADGADLRFADGDGSMLDYEIEQWNPEGESLVWVEVPQIDGASSQDYILMKWGNPEASDAQVPEGVWSNHYTGVWHLGDDLTDSAGGSDGADSGSNPAGGLVAGGREFNDSTDYIDLGRGNPADAETGDLTIEAWARYNGESSHDIIMAKQDTFSSDDMMWNLTRYPNTDALRLQKRDSVAEFNIDLPAGDWAHVAVTMLGANLHAKLYLDGQYQTAGTMLPGTDTEAKLAIGNYVGGSSGFNGTLDEVRVSDVVRSADWLRAQQLSMTDRFITFHGLNKSFWPNVMRVNFSTEGLTEPLFDFPALVVLNLAKVNTMDFKPGGADIRFLDASGKSLIPHEIEHWETFGDSYIWVKVPEISQGVNHIWMLWGNPDAEDGQNPPGVWSNGYLGVWHLNENGSANNADSTMYANHGTRNGNSRFSSGRIAGGQMFDTSLDDYIDVMPDESLDTTFLTLSAWAFSGMSGPAYSVTPPPAPGAYGLFVNGLTDRVRFDVDLETQRAGAEADNVLDTVWHHYAAAYDGETAQLYVDGTLQSDVNQVDGTLSTDTGGGLRMGSDRDNGMTWYGILDEVRISNVPRSAEWLDAQLRSMNDELVTLGLPTDIDGDGCVNVADLLTVRNNLGNSGSDITPRASDVNSDAIVNVADLLLVRNALGSGHACN